VQQQLPSTFTKIMNGLLGNPILEVSIDTTEGEALPCTLTRLFEGVWQISHCHSGNVGFGQRAVQQRSQKLA
jgi:hypothetical protein